MIRIAIVAAVNVLGAAEHINDPDSPSRPENSPMNTPGTPGSPKRSVEIVSHINAPPEAVWRALTDADELIQWFPLEARVTPGASGAIFTSWKNENQWESPITIWEPNRRLRNLWCPRETPEPEQFGVDYFLEACGDGTTTLRLVHFGFGAEPQWNEMYDGVSRGWDHMTWCLKEYLEKHRGEKRAVVYVGANIDESACDAAWRRFFSAEGLFPDAALMSAKPGQAFSLRLATGDEARGVVRRLVPGKDFSAKIDSLGDATLNVQIHRRHMGQGFKIQVSLSTFGLDAARIEAMTKSWQAAVERAAQAK